MSSAARRNPFRQSARQWRIGILAPRDSVECIEEVFADCALAVLSFEVDASGLWRVDILTGALPEEDEVRSRLALASGLMEAATPRFSIEEVIARDWVKETERSFAPFAVGRFYVHGSHVANVPQGYIGLRIDAGAAFGSGEHATTSGCLTALGLLARRRRFLRPLDMGTGSGILAIAMAKLWRCPVIGIDVDPVSVAVARANAGINHAQTHTRFGVGDGYHAALARTHAPFDLIVANILARPLVKMAPRLAANLMPDGIAVLSGLLADQERMVQAAHRAQGLKLVARICRHGWNTLVMTR